MLNVETGPRSSVAWAWRTWPPIALVAAALADTAFDIGSEFAAGRAAFALAAGVAAIQLAAITRLRHEYRRRWYAAGFEDGWSEAARTIVDNLHADGEHTAAGALADTLTEFETHRRPR